ncbi:MAG: MFS transporter [Solirubrobacterales bacterium]|nr:MFS transporter [Solirubrobacterales bacterium]
MSTGRSAQAVEAFAQTARSPSLRGAQLSYAAAFSSHWAMMVALGILAFHHGGAAAVGVVGLVSMLPAALLTPAAGALVDRYRRDRVLLGVCLVRTAALVGAALAVGLSSPWPAYALAAIAVVAHTMYRPSHSALLPVLSTTATELTSANAVRGALDSLSALCGPLLAGVLVGPLGVGGVFTVSAVVALWAAWLIWRVDYEPPPRVVEEERAHPVRGVLEGLAVLRRRPDVGVLTVLGTLQTFTRGCFTVFVVVIPLQLLGLQASGVGVLTAGLGAGAVLGSFGASLLVGSKGLGRWVAVGVAGWGLPFIAMAAASSEIVALVLLGVVGIANAIIDLSLFTLLQWLVPDEMMGRVFTTVESTFTLGVALGAIAASGLIAAFGIRGALVAAGLICPVAALLALPRLRRIDAKVHVAGEVVALLQRVAMLRPLPLATISRLAGEASPEHVDAGATVIEEGTRGDDFYVIMEGEAGVSVDGEDVWHLGSADCFGEIAGLTGSRRTSTVRAETNLELLRFKGPQFVRTVTGYGSSNTAALTLIDERLERGVSDAARTKSAPEIVAMAGRKHEP